MDHNAVDHLKKGNKSLGIKIIYLFIVILLLIIYNLYL